MKARSTITLAAVLRRLAYRSGVVMVPEWFALPLKFSIPPEEAISFLAELGLISRQEHLGPLRFVNTDRLFPAWLHLAFARVYLVMLTARSDAVH